MIYATLRQGGIHAFERVPCQDCIHTLRRGSVQAAALCDGAGSLPGAYQAAHAFSRAMCQWIAENLPRLLRMPEERVRLLAADRIEEVLSDLALGHPEAKSAFGCTLLLCAMDMKTGASLCLQLGDGLIAECRGTGAVPLSLPNQGREHRSTYLTTSSRETILARMQVIRGRDGQAFFLMSDGAEGAFYRIDGQRVTPTAGLFPELLQEFQLRPRAFHQMMEYLLAARIKPTDDFSLGILCRDAPPLPPSPGPCRVQKSYARYLAARRSGASPLSACRLAGWRKRDLPKRRAWLLSRQIEETCPDPLPVSL